ncbi:MAG: aryl-sulfate sulfotransferase [Cyclobacteriaceae bacterium]|nr:aryl-sulfate sulfotransferase [Cyclobacteriaceae bacterium]
MSESSVKTLIFSILLTGVILAGCDREFADIQYSRISDQNQLIFEIEFSTDKISDAFVEYWPEHEPVTRYSGLSSGRRDHHLSIYNLSPDATFQYRIITKTSNKIRHSRIQDFRTGKLPEQLPSFDLIIDGHDFEGYILLKAYTNPGALILLNQQAKIVWYQLYDSPVVRPFEFTFDGNFLSLVDSSIIEETTLDGKIFRKIDTRDHGIDKLHHELFKSREQHYISLTYTRSISDLSTKGGSRQDTIHGDGMVVIDSTGRKIWEWDIFDYADPALDDSILQWKHDWAHANSIALDPEGNYLVSMRNLSQIWKINSHTGEVIWKLGRNGNFRIKGTEWFIRQHDVHVNSDGHLMMFDNGNAQRGYSRVLALEIDEENYEVRPVIDIKLDQSGTTFRMGSARMIDHQHILVCSPKKLLTLSILDKNGETVWRLSGTKDSYKACYIPGNRIDNKKWF